jgi:acyl carrier protein
VLDSEDEITGRVRGIMVDLFQVDRAALTPESSRDTIGSWDSANHLTLILALEEEFGVSFEVSEIESMFSLQDILAVLESKL